MAELNMIDTMGYGIHEIYQGQAQRYFPLPDYDLARPDAVSLTIHGAIVDPSYSRLLIGKTDLPLSDIVALDRVQKGLPIDETTVRRLRKEKLIEGRKPNLHVSAQIASASDTKGEYIRKRSQDDTFYKQLVLDYLEEFGHASRQEIDDLLWSKLSEGLTDEQKQSKISNLITAMRRAEQIQNVASKKAPEWRLQNKNGPNAE